MENEKLIRDSEKLEMIKRYVKGTEYIEKRVLEILLDIKSKEDGE
ncbi:hypothetical protein [Bacillus infantis]